MLCERAMDNKLGIKTRGIREYVGRNHGFNRYEATSYRALKALLSHYRFAKNSRLVDFGCGKGRVLFYLHHRLGIPVVGVEGDHETYLDALRNKASYQAKHPHPQEDIILEYCFAEVYKIKPDENVFFFFNPFDLVTFREVVLNIIESYGLYPRRMDIILYYPYPDYEKFLWHNTDFKPRQKISWGASDKYEKFLIFRLE